MPPRQGAGRSQEMRVPGDRERVQQRRGLGFSQLGGEVFEAVAGNESQQIFVAHGLELTATGIVSHPVRGGEAGQRGLSPMAGGRHEPLSGRRRLKRDVSDSALKTHALTQNLRGRSAGRDGRGQTPERQGAMDIARDQQPATNAVSWGPKTRRDGPRSPGWLKCRWVLFQVGSRQTVFSSGGGI